jgi:hypothetical protein
MSFSTEKHTPQPPLAERGLGGVSFSDELIPWKKTYPIKG